MMINYTNERMQYQFNMYVFKLEQEEYRKEGIDWSFVDFPDNTEVLNLIESQSAGILKLLDDQCLINGTDAAFSNALYNRLTDHECFAASSLRQGKSEFVIRHYAGEVIYTATGFVEKNKDSLFQVIKFLPKPMPP